MVEKKVVENSMVENYFGAFYSMMEFNFGAKWLWCKMLGANKFWWRNKGTKN